MLRDCMLAAAGVVGIRRWRRRPQRPSVDFGKAHLDHRRLPRLPHRRLCRDRRQDRSATSPQGQPGRLRRARGAPTSPAISGSIAANMSEDDWVTFVKTFTVGPPMPWFNVHALDRGRDALALRVHQVAGRYRRPGARRRSAGRQGDHVPTSILARRSCRKLAVTSLRVGAGIAARSPAAAVGTEASAHAGRLLMPGRPARSGRPRAACGQDPPLAQRVDQGTDCEAWSPDLHDRLDTLGRQRRAWHRPLPRARRYSQQALDKTPDSPASPTPIQNLSTRRRPRA